MGEYALTAGLFGASERIFRIFNSRSRTIPIGISMSVNFQDENEVKDYLNTIGTEYRFGCYSEKNPESCHLLGDYFETIRKDFEKARKVYQSNCVDYNYAKSCLKFGNYVFIGKGKSGAKGNPAEALQYYSKGCELGDADSCLHSGLIHVSKQPMHDAPTIERNFPLGVKHLTRGCELNNANACFYLSGMHISGIQSTTPSVAAPAPSDVGRKSSSGSKVVLPAATTTLSSGDSVIVKDMQKAFTFAYKACELRNMYACANLSQMYSRGEGTEKSEEKAEKFKKLALEMQDEVKNNKSQLAFQQMH